MATVVQSSLLGKRVLYVKGAPEIVLANSNRVAIDGTYKPVEECKASIEKQLLDYQNQAMRTLGFAYQILEDGQDATFFVNGRLHKTDLTYLGIVAISDPVRADVPAAVLLSGWGVPRPARRAARDGLGAERALAAGAGRAARHRRDGSGHLGRSGPAV